MFLFLALLEMLELLGKNLIKYTKAVLLNTVCQYPKPKGFSACLFSFNGMTEWEVTCHLL